MQHRPAAPAFVVASALVAVGSVLGLLSVAGFRDLAVIGLVLVAAGLVSALVGMVRLAVGVDYLTYRELEREAGRDFVVDPSSDLTEHQQRTAARAGQPLLTHEARMARIHRAVKESGSDS